MKQLIILKSVSGGGKTTLISYLEKEYGQPALICSADHFFYFGKEQIPENYKFDFNKLFIAHKECKNKFSEAIKSNYPLIIIDNTNLVQKDWKFYYLTARENNYNVTFHTIKPGTVEQHFDSNVHNVPKKIIENQIKKFTSLPKEFNGELLDEVVYDFNQLRKKYGTFKKNN